MISRTAGLKNWLQFVRGEGHLIREYPTALFQQAANCPEDTLQARAAKTRWQSGRRVSPWLRWRNRPEGETGPPLVLRHPTTVFDCSISSSTGLIATGCEDALRLWSSETGEELRKFTSAKRWKFCALSPDASRLMGCSNDGPLIVLDTKTGSTTAEIKTGHSYGFKWLNNERVLTAHHERFLSWETGTTEWLVISQEATNIYVNDFSVSPDGRSVALATDSGLAIRDLSTGSLLKSIHHEGNRFVYCIWLTNERIAAGVDRLPVCVWNSLDGSLIRQLTSDPLGRARAMCPDGIRLATISGSHLEIWNTETGVLLSRVKAHTHLISACAWSEDGTQVVTGAWDSTARVWDAESLRTPRDSTRHKREVNYVAFSPDSRTVVSGADDGSVIFWNVESGEAKTGTHAGPITGLGFKNSDRVYSTAAETPASVQVWDALSGADLEWFMLPTHTLASDFSPDGKWMACLGSDYVLRIIDTQLQKFTDQIAGIGGLLEASLCAFSPNNRRLLSVAPRNRLWVFDVEEHRQCFRTADWIDNREGFSLASCLRDASFSPDGSRVVAPVTGGDLQVYDSVTGQETLRLTARGFDVWTVDWSPDGRLIAASGDERVISIWETDTGLLWSRLSRHTHRVNDCAFSPCSSRLASVSLLDQQTFVWDVNNGSVMAVFQGVAGKKVVWSRDGLFIAVGGDEGLVAILGLEGF